VLAGAGYITQAVIGALLVVIAHLALRPMICVSSRRKPFSSG
jgi:hypothetical protein